MSFSKTTPQLRIFDEAKARQFYLDYLGFALDWEHRFGPNMPLYCQVSRDGCTLHLTEHHGDATPGSGVCIQCGDLDAFLAELRGKDYRHLNPGIEKMPWGSRNLQLTDPFGNRLTFTNAISTA
ncbi:MAG: glyoxalase superfamily protein [Verrucomicrobiota bacterium]